MQGTHILLATCVSWHICLTTTCLAADPTRIIQAEDVLDRIARGEAVGYRDVTIRGNLNLRDVQLRTTQYRGRELQLVDSKIEITTSTIEGRVDFSDALFNEEVDFFGTVFKSPASFTRAWFRGGEAAKQDTARDGGNAWFYEYFVRCADDPTLPAKYGMDGGARVLYIKKGTPPDRAGLKVGDFVTAINGNKVDGVWDLGELMAATSAGKPPKVTVLRDSVELEFETSLAEKHELTSDNKDSVLSFLEEPRYFSFSHARFHEDAFFADCCFEKDVGFVETQFDKRGFFNGTTYGGIVDFAGCSFSWPASFVEGYFVREANFSHAHFYQFANFASSYFNSNVDFAFSRIENGVSFEQAMFNGTVGLSGIDCERMLINWSQISERLEYDRAAYAFLSLDFQKLGKYEDADAAYYEYRKRSRKLLHWWDPRRALEYIFLDLSCGYGTRPFRAIYFSFGVIGLFGLLFWRRGALTTRSLTATTDCGRLRRLGDALYFSVNTFTTVGYGDWVPTEEHLLNLGRFKLFKSRHVAMVEGFLGWVMLSLFLITLARTWIR